jgi:hypothetical protein
VTEHSSRRPAARPSAPSIKRRSRAVGKAGRSDSRLLRRSRRKTPSGCSGGIIDDPRRADLATSARSIDFALWRNRRENSMIAAAPPGETVGDGGSCVCRGGQMAWLVSVALFLLIATRMMQQIRDDRRRGIVIDWRKTFWTAAGVILVTLMGVAALIFALTRGQDALGVGLFALIVGGGIFALAKTVNRIWPPTPL